MSRGYLLNATGRELPNDMACASTIEPYKLDKDAEEFFYDEFCNLPLNERIDRIVALFERNKQLVGSFIVENNELGRGLMDRVPQEKFVISVKRPNSTLHWTWSNIDRLKAPATDNVDMDSQQYSPLSELPVAEKKSSDEWLKTAIVAPDGQPASNRDFHNIWTAGADQSIIQANPGVNVGAMPTDEDMANLAKLANPEIFVEYSKKVESGVPLTLEESIKAIAEFARITGIVNEARKPLLARIAALEKTVSHYRSGYGSPANELFQAIKHGDGKHQAWLEAALVAFYSGKEIPTEAEVSALKQAATDARQSTSNNDDQ